jgi:hypothetical protein
LAGKVSAGVLVSVGVVVVIVVVWLVIRIRLRKHQRLLLEHSHAMTMDDVIEISNVEIEQALGAGNFGQVFKGKWAGNLVALKKLKDMSKLKEFLDEAKLLKELKHPHMVQFFGIFNSDIHGPLLVY